MAPFWHRWSYFSIINLSVFHLADKCFTIANLINLRIILFLEYRKTPETQGFWGILRLDTECTPDTQFISSYNYSMIVATRPDPTVRPPSRCFWDGIYLPRIDFACFIGSYYHGFHVISVVFEIFRTILEPRYILIYAYSSNISFPFFALFLNLSICSFSIC